VAQAYARPWVQFPVSPKKKKKKFLNLSKKDQKGRNKQRNNNKNIFYELKKKQM
jgi:hypothetical protein